MGTHLLFATGNAYKFYEASQIAARYGVTLEQRTIDIDEIQHHDPIKITEAKARAAYDVVGEPVVVNDSNWSIPALGGFPGGYMKDVKAWLSADDFLALLRDKKDKRIFLNETIVYTDGATQHTCTNSRPAHFVEDAAYEGVGDLDDVVYMEDMQGIIAHIVKDGEWSTEDKTALKHWYEFAEWYARRGAT